MYKIALLYYYLPGIRPSALSVSDELDISYASFGRHVAKRHLHLCINSKPNIRFSWYEFGLVTRLNCMMIHNHITLFVPFLHSRTTICDTHTKLDWRRSVSDQRRQGSCRLSAVSGPNSSGKVQQDSPPFQRRLRRLADSRCVC